MLREARLDPAGGGFDYGGIDRLVADFGDGLFQKRIEIRILWRHLISPMYERNSCWIRSRVRDNVTATLAGVVPRDWAISGLSRPSKKRRANISAARGLSRATAWRSQMRISVDRCKRSGASEALAESKGATSSRGTCGEACRERIR